VAGSAAVLALVLPAPARAAGNQPGRCTKLAAKPSGTTIQGTLTGCAPIPATGGKGAVTIKSNGATGTVTIKWAAGTGTTRAKVTFANQSSPGKCGGATRVKITGKVTGGAGIALKAFKKGQPVTASACVGPTAVKLEPGTVVRF
jgi:hypothetical protein